jgi:hypothetical protein
MPKSNAQDELGFLDGVTATVLLTPAGLAAHLSTGAVMNNPDPVALADMLLTAGLTAQAIRMTDWRAGDHAPLTGHKIALMQRMRHGSLGPG